MKQDTTRRAFLKTCTTALAAGALAELAIPSNVHAAGSDMLRIGLIGCGNRGTGAAIPAGKHVFAEKPVAVDIPGLNRVRAACDEAKQKNLAVVSGLHNRYNYDIRATMAKIHDGAIGDVLFVQSAWNGNLPAKPWP